MGEPINGLASEPRRNLLLLSIDAWRADFVDHYQGVPLTPALQAVAARTLRFDRAYTTGPWTTPGIVSMLTGKDALSHGIWYEWSVPQPGQASLPSLLAQAGYQIIGLSHKTRDGNFQNLGFDPTKAPPYPTGPGEDLLPQTLRALATHSSGQPWFTWYHYKFVHLPYWPAPDYLRLFSVDADHLPARLRDSVCKLSVVPRGKHRFLSEDRDLIQRLYAANVRQMDDFLGRVLASLDESGQMENTTIVITADHGDEHLDHGYVGHASTALFATLYEEVLRVPLMIIDSRIKGPLCSQARVQHQDLMPTLLSLGGASTPLGLFNAVDLSPLVFQATGDSPQGETGVPVPLGPQRPLRFHSSRMGYRTPRRRQGQAIVGFLRDNTKYICERFDRERRLLFDLSADPSERNPVADRSAIEAAHAELCDLYPGLNQAISKLHRIRGLARDFFG